MNNNMNKDLTEDVLAVVASKIESLFGERPNRAATLVLAKGLGYVKGKQGRCGGTFAQEKGLALLALVDSANDAEGVAQDTSQTLSATDIDADTF